MGPAIPASPKLGTIQPPDRTAPGAFPRLLLPVAVLVILLLYSAPYLLTMGEARSQVPPVFGQDLYFYLNISQLHASPAGMLVNPWYGVEVPAGALAYWKFRAGFACFDALRSVLGGNWSATLLVWSAVWTVLVVLAGIYAFRRILPRSALAVSLAVLFLMLFDVTLLPASASAWLHASLSGFREVRLPYARAFFPQMAIPFLVAYIGLQIEVLRTRRRALWVVMALSQLAALSCFPYAALLMAGTTAMVLVFGRLGRRFEISWLDVLGFAALCGALDGAYLLLTQASRAAAAVTVRDAVLSMSFGRLPYMLLGHAKMLGLLALATGGCALVRDLETKTSRWVLVALGSATLLLSFADVFVSPMFQISDHILLYFAHTVLVLLLVFLVAAGCRALPQPRRLRWVAAPLMLFLLLHAALAVAGNMRKYKPLNESTAATAALLGSLQLQPHDLVLAPADAVDDMSCWLPLASGARVVFCFNAELALDPASKAPYQTFRQSMYLYFRGRSSAQLSDLLSRRDRTAEPEQYRYAQIRERLLFHDPVRDQMLASLKEALVPAVRRLEAGDPEVSKFFAAYDRIVVVDSAEKPAFVPERLQKYLQVESESVVNGQRVRSCRPQRSQ